MSRWDALRPDNPKSNQKSWHQTNRRNKEVSRSSNSDRAQKSTQQPNDSINLKHRKKSFQNESVQELTECKLLKLQQRLQAIPEDTDCIQQIADLLRSSNGFLLPSTTLAQIVQEIILKFLNFCDCRNERQARTAVSVLEALLDIIDTAGYRPILMVASVQEVLQEGEEQTKENPIRSALRSSLQGVFLRSLPYLEHCNNCTNDDTIRQIVNTCTKCVVKYLNTARAIDGRKLHTKGLDTDFDSTVLLRWLHVLMKRESNHVFDIPALEALEAILLRHPDCAAFYFSNLLLPNICTEEENDSCSFLRFIKVECTSTEKQSKINTLVFSCIAHMLTNSPLYLWLRLGHMEHKFNPSSLQRKCIEGLKGIIKVACECMKSFHELGRCVESFCYLVEILLTRVPYSNVLLEQHACDLVCAFITQLVGAVETVAGNNHRRCLLSTFIICLGGKVTPLGNKTTISAPILSFLRGRIIQGSEVEATLTIPILNTISTSSIVGIDCDFERQLLGAILKSYPHIVTSSDSVYSSYFALLTQMINHNEEIVSLNGLQLLCALLEGRQEEAVYLDDSLSVTDGFLDFALSLIIPIHIKAFDSRKVVCCDAIGCLTKTDWLWMATHSPRLTVHDAIRPILSIVSDNIASSNEKCTACRSLGIVCSQIFSSDNISENGEDSGWNESLMEIILPALELSLFQDVSPSARSMSLFAIGNLANAVTEFSMDVVSTAAIYVKMGHKCLEYVDFADDKVAGNAIRSIGHIVAIFMSDTHDRFDSTVLLDSTVDTLTQKLRTVLLLGKSTETLHLTLKQRLGVKKHGCGVCNAFALLFKRFKVSNILYNRQLAFCSKPFVVILESIHMISSLPAKLAISALVALRSLHSEICMELISQSNCEHLVQSSLISCFKCVLESRQDFLLTKVFQEVELTLLYLLSCANDSVIESLVKSDWLKEEQEFLQLYHWLVSKDISSKTMNAFNSAIQKHHTLVNFQVERLFANFVLRSQREQGEVSHDEDEL